MDGRVPARILWLLTTLFLARVAGQLVAAVAASSAVPPFDAWQGSSLPYPALLGTQVALLAGMSLTAAAVGRGTVRARPRVGRWLMSLAGVYGATMLGRVILGLTVLRDVPWFAKPLPALFHLVLAAYLAVYARVHLRHA